MELNVFLEGDEDPVGTLARSPEMDVSFRYRPDYAGRALSIRLPVREHAYGDQETRGYFANLLQEGARLDEIAARHRIERSDIVGLLAHVGLDCAGAVSIARPGEASAKTPGVLDRDYYPYAEEDLAADVEALEARRAVRRGARFSLAGVQSKMAVGMNEGGEILHAEEGAPTTHIVKVGRPDFPGLVENEFLVMKTAEALGLPVAGCERREAGGRTFLLIERFDREVETGSVHRLHQEDACQALGLSPSVKYARDLPEGQSPRADFPHLFELEDALGDPLSFRQNIPRVAFFNWLVGNSDAHAKNFAFMHPVGGRPYLADFYDLVCIAVYPDVSQELAMPIGRHDAWDAVSVEDWEELLGLLQIKGSAARRIIKRDLLPIAEQALDTMASVIADHGLRMTMARRVRDSLGPRIDRVNELFNLEIEVDTDGFDPRAGGWTL